MKKPILIATIVIAGMTGPAWAQTAGTAQRPTSAAQSSATDTETFVREMAIAGLAEVQLGQLAAKRAQSQDVKAYGQMMVKDHTRANTELMQAAKRLSVTVPTKLDNRHQQIADKLASLKGEAFDREYMRVMVMSHQEVATQLRARAGTTTTAGNLAGSASTPAGSSTSGSQSGQAGAAGTSGSMTGDQALASWADKTLPAVEQHLGRPRAALLRNPGHLDDRGAVPEWDATGATVAALAGAAAGVAVGARLLPGVVGSRLGLASVVGTAVVLGVGAA